MRIQEEQPNDGRMLVDDMKVGDVYIPCNTTRPGVLARNLLYMIVENYEGRRSLDLKQNKIYVTPDWWDNEGYGYPVDALMTYSRRSQ